MSSPHVLSETVQMNLSKTTISKRLQHFVDLYSVIHAWSHFYWKKFIFTIFTNVIIHFQNVVRHHQAFIFFNSSIYLLPRDHCLWPNQSLMGKGILWDVLNILFFWKISAQNPHIHPTQQCMKCKCRFSIKIRGEVQNVKAQISMTMIQQ